MKFNLAFFSVILWITFNASAQSGPAGVGSSLNNPLWLKADAGTSSSVNGTPISSWNDQSGNGINVSQANFAQRPLYRSNIHNGFPAIEFDNNSSSGQNDLLWAPDNPLLDNTTGYTFFMVVTPGNLDGNARSIISKRTNINSDEAFMLFFYTGNRFFVDIDGLNDRFNTPVPAFAVNNPNLLNVHFDGTLPASSRVKVYREEQLVSTAYESAGLVPNMPSPLVIGATHTGDNRPFGGFMAELILYTEALNDASRIIVNNHLSAKYDLPLSANDYYAGDNTANGDYDFDVAGIGKSINGSNNQFAASSCAGLSLSINSGLDTGDFVLAGHNSTANNQITTDVGGMTGPNNSRWQRIWYMDVTNSGSALNLGVEFDMSDGGFPALTTGAASNYVLLYRPGNSGNWTELAIANATPGDKVIFNSVSLVNDGYYTVGSKNRIISPLPVQLNNFSGTCDGNLLTIQWETLSEANSGYFGVEFSRDGVHYTQVHKVDGAGNSNTPRRYSFQSDEQESGFYQLRQTDLDGKSEVYGPIMVRCDKPEIREPSIYPNPAVNNVTIDMQGENTGRLEILSVSGQLVWQGEVTGSREINISSFSKGLFLFKISNDATGEIFSRKILLGQ